MKIWLVEPPHRTWKLFQMSAPSLGLASLAAVLEADHDVTVVDFSTLVGGWAEFEWRLRIEEPDLVGVTAILTYYFPEALQVGALVRSVLPSATVVGGGYQFTACAEEALATGNFDAIVRGEGEDTFADLAAGLPAERIDGLSYRDGERVVHNPDRKPRVDLDSLPAPAWHKFRMEAYPMGPLGGRRATTLTVSRGCPYRCGFCSETYMWGSTIRRNSPQRAVDLLEILRRRHGRDTILFGDNDFLGDPAWVDDFLTALERRRLGVGYWIQTTCLSVTRSPSLLRALRRSGCTHVMLGLESVSPEVLRRYCKPQTREIMDRATGLVRDAGMSPFGFLMWGDVEDTTETLRSGIDYLLERCDLFSVNTILPLPATRYRSDSGCSDTDFGTYDKYQMILGPRGMSREAAQSTWDDAAFSRPITRRLLREALLGKTPAARSWARHSLLVEWLFDWLPAPRDTFEAYHAERGRAVPTWRLGPAVGDRGSTAGAQAAI